jgi:diguanylate cyclase (GGDEF)-like protein/PAS domain S-box-containing protein
MFKDRAMQSIQNIVYMLVLIITAGVGIVLAFHTLRRRKVPGGGLVGVMLFLAAWLGLTYAIGLASSTSAARFFWVKVEYIAIVAFIPILLIFALRYTGHTRLLKRPFYLAMAVEPLIVLVLVWSTPGHTWYYQSYSLDVVGSQLIWHVVYGAGFWIHTIYGALLYLISAGLFLQKMIQTRQQQRRQTGFILIGILLAGIGDIIYVLSIGPVDFDLTPVIILISAMVIAWSILRSHFFGLTPIALEAVMRSMGDGVILVNPHGWIVDLNPAAERIVGKIPTQESMVPLETVLPGVAGEIEKLAPMAEAHLTVDLGSQDGDGHILSVNITPVRDDHGLIEGRLLLLRDVGESLRSRQELEKREADLREARNFLEKVISTVPLGIFIYNLATRKIEFGNRQQGIAGRFLEDYNQLPMEDRREIVHPEDREKTSEFMRHLHELADGEVRELEYRWSKANEWAWMRMYYAVFQREPTGQIASILTISDDITGLRRALTSLAESEKRFRSLFEGLPIGLYRTTANGRLVDINQAMVNLLHYPNRESLLARNVFDLYANPADRSQQIEAIKQGNIDHFEMQLVCWDGEVIWVNDSPRTVIGAEGETIFEGSLVDISHRKEVENELLASEKKFRNIFDLSPNSVMLADLSANILDCNIGTLQVHGAASKQDLIGSNITVLVAPEYHLRLFELMETTLEESGVQGVELIMLRSDASRFPAEISTSIIPNVAGRPTMMIITVMDISSRKEAEFKLQVTQAQLGQRVDELEARTHQITLLTEMSNMLQVCLRPDEAYNFIGRYAARLFSQTAGVLMIFNPNSKQLLPQARWGQLEVEPLAYAMEDCWALRSGQAYLAPEGGAARLCRHFQQKLTHGSLCVPILSEGEIIGVINLLACEGSGSLMEAQIQLASAMAEQIGLALSNLQLRDNLHQQAIHDPLTGLYNRYHLRESLESELIVAEQTGAPVSVVMIDLDHFKAMNTRYGHLNVDALLSEFGKLMQSFAINGEVALRYGGDEFVLILPNTSLEQAGERAEQLRRRVRQLVVNLGGQSIQNLTLSIGIAGWPRHGRTFTELLKAADAALFRAKEERDRVVIAD